MPPLPSTFIPPPLDEAIPLELYERCLAPKPADVVVQEDRQPTPNEEVNVFLILTLQCIHSVFKLHRKIK